MKDFRVGDIVTTALHKTDGRRSHARVVKTSPTGRVTILGRGSRLCPCAHTNSVSSKGVDTTAS